MTSGPQSSDSYKHRIPDPDPERMHAMFHEYLNLLGLTNKFPRKLTMRDAIEIRMGKIDTDDIKILPYLILQKVMTFDVRSRSSLYTGKLQLQSGSTLEGLDEINPLDSFITLLNCCSNLLTQDILTRLSTCQLAIPFLLPNPDDGSVRCLMWGMREIVRSWKSKDSKAPNECRIIDYPAPIVSFYKIGKSQQSKSKIINEVISESKVDYFFNWDCKGGTANPLFVSGMVELCCYLPSGKKDANDFYSNIIIFLNLRGDARNHTKQIDFMKQSSFMSFVLLGENDLDAEAFKLLQKLQGESKPPEPPKPVILMFTDLKNSENIKNAKTLQQINDMKLCVIKLKGKNSAKIREEIRKEIVQKLSLGTQTDHKRLSECVEIAQSSRIQVDEDDKACKNGKDLAIKVMKQVTSFPDYEAKLKILPLQGPQMWQRWATLDKETHRQLSRNKLSRDKSVDAYSYDVEQEMKDVREAQFKFITNPTKAMMEFASNLVVYSGNTRFYFLQWLKMFLDDHSRKVLPKLNTVYQETRTKLKDAKAENKNQQQDSPKVTSLKMKLKSQNEQLVNASFGLEHFFREMGQIYEAKMDNSNKNAQTGLREISSYPQIVADLMTEGFPVELMDGDAAHVPITWVLAVIDKLKDKYLQNQRIFIISVLGVQSTGKSTLLNTTFGLRFNVSAGRCTRGAYFQLLSCNSAQTGYDHILIVDTEGLRAPELQFKEQQRHDNELATFVIGLADMTIVNIYGETPGELTDILQTSVHAFIRMKNVDMQLSCHFVHQNVTAVTAQDKSKVGRQNFQENLDKMTIAAAKIEKCEEKFRSFQDVIQFNDETNVTFFPSLWKGDPPMAPVNPGYSSKACELKETMIATFKDHRHKQNGKHNCNFAEFHMRVKTLWSAVLQEKFVFSFKNTLEVTAYNELDMQYSEWSIELRQVLFEGQRKAKNQVRYCDNKVLNSVVKSHQFAIEKSLDRVHEQLNEKLVTFFEKSENSDTLTQWRKKTEVRLEQLRDEYKGEAINYCKVLCQNREAQVEIDREKQDYRKRLQAQIVALASDNKKFDLSDTERKNLFDEHWTVWINALSTKNRQVNYTTPKAMELEITEILEEKYCAHSQYITVGLKTRPVSKRGSLELEVLTAHLQPTSTGWKEWVKGKVGLSKSDKYPGINKDLDLAKMQQEKFFNEVRGWMVSILENCQDFNKSSVDRLLTNLQKSVEQFNKKKNNFILTPQYQVDIALTVAGYAYEKFNTKIKELKSENDPVNAMNQNKESFFLAFETQLSEASNDQNAAHNICNVLRKPIEKALIDELQTEIFKDMRQAGSHYKRKNYFKVLVMKDLAAKKKFRLYQVYLRNVSESLKYWSKVYVIQHCELEERKGITKLHKLAEENLTEIIKPIKTAFTNLLPGTTTSMDTTISVEDLKNSPQNYDIKAWLDNFHKQVQTVLAVDPEELKDMVFGIKSIHRPVVFAKHLFKYLEEQKKAIMFDFTNTHNGIRNLTTDSEKSPHMLLYNSLIGCEEQCPFCNEQCEITDKDHVDKGKLHYTEIHRPQCLGGYIDKEDEKLVYEICTKSVEGTDEFANAETDHQYYPYKDYKRFYPKWLISTENELTGPKYWQWFIAEYNTELVAWNKAKPSPVTGPKVTENDAIKSLAKTYGIDT